MADDNPKMMPGQQPYTDEELQQLARLLVGAIAAEDCFSEDELERYAEERQRSFKRS